MTKLSKYRWSLWSVAVNVGTAVATLTAIQYLYHHGGFRLRSQLGSEIDGLGGIGVLISFVLTVVGLAKEESPFMGIVALGLSVFSVACYSR
jgi:hypothetical protein